MALFNPSSKSVSAAVQEIADAAGASADTEMNNRAGRSLNAAIGYFNGRANWQFMLTEATPITVFAPFGVANVTASAGQSSATVPAGHGLQIDDYLSGSAFAAATRILTTAAGSFTFMGTITSAIGAGTKTIPCTASRDMYSLPADFKMPYSVRLISAQKHLRLRRRRFIDRTSSDEFMASTPEAYDIFYVGAKGKIRLDPAPIGADTLMLRYFRRMTTPTTTADATVLDIPQDYDPYLVAWAKWHFLVDKSDRQEQASTWISFANDGIKTMMSDQTRIPDEDVAFIPGHTAGTISTDSVLFTNDPW